MKGNHPSAIKRIVREPMFRQRVERPGKGKGSFNRKDKRQLGEEDHEVLRTDDVE